MSDSKLCPSCSRIAETHLEPMQAKGVQLDYCGSCSGIWLDRGEWTDVFGQAPDQYELEGSPFDEPLKCASCIDDQGESKKLSKCRFPGGPPVEVDACRACAGIWLDPGEMQALKRYYDGTPAQPPPHFDDVAEAWGGRQTSPNPTSTPSRALGTAHGSQRASGILIFVVAAVILALYWPQISIGLSSPSWPTTEGEITRRWSESRRETTTREDGRRRSRTVTYDYVEYRYEVDGLTLSSKRYDANRRSKFVPSRLSEGESVSVAYDPADPQRAVIETGLTFSTTIALLVSIAGLILGVLGFLGYIDPTLGGRLTSTRWWTMRWG